MFIETLTSDSRAQKRINQRTVADSHQRVCARITSSSSKAPRPKPATEAGSRRVAVGPAPMAAPRVLEVRVALLLERAVARAEGGSRLVGVGAPWLPKPEVDSGVTGTAAAELLAETGKGDVAELVEFAEAGVSGGAEGVGEGCGAAAEAVEVEVW